MVDEGERARRLVNRYGWNTTCYQVVNPGIERWFSTDGEALVGYVRKQRRRVVAGAPICSSPSLKGVIQEWEAADPGCPACYVGAEERVHTVLSDDPEYTTVVLGAQPVWSLQGWTRSFETDASLRYQLQRARRKGVTVTEWPAARAQASPDLQRVLREWLRTRGLPPMHFLVEPDTLECLGDRRLFVAEQNRRVVGFVTMAPIPTRKGWLTEQFVRGEGAPNGTIELMLNTAVQAVGQAGAEIVTMGIVPLSTHAREDARNPAWLRILTAWMRAHGRRFYNFDGLDRFKSKFHPDYWEPIYVISRERRFSLRTLYAIAAAFTQQNPILAVAKGLLGAVRQEIQWLAKGKQRT